MTTSTLVTLLCALLICTRLLTFRRRGARYRLGIRILTQSGYPAGWGIALVMAVLAWLVWRARGNVAQVIKLRRL